MYNKKCSPCEHGVNVAKTTGDVYIDYGREASEALCPEISQPYFILRDRHHEFAFGLKDMLKCLEFAEEIGEIPPSPDSWWREVKGRYRIEQVQDIAGQVRGARD